MNGIMTPAVRLIFAAQNVHFWRGKDRILCVLPHTLPSPLVKVGHDNVNFHNRSGHEHKTAAHTSRARCALERSS
jgi:hypothetical protein